MILRPAYLLATSALLALDGAPFFSTIRWFTPIAMMPPRQSIRQSKPPMHPPIPLPMAPTRQRGSQHPEDDWDDRNGHGGGAGTTLMDTVGGNVTGRPSTVNEAAVVPARAHHMHTQSSVSLDACAYRRLHAFHVSRCCVVPRFTQIGF